jgi:hypothetical protein
MQLLIPGNQPPYSARFEPIQLKLGLNTYGVDPLFERGIVSPEDVRKNRDMTNGMQKAIISLNPLFSSCP